MKYVSRIVEKPWGHERIWAETEKYVGKILHINAGEALSLQYHEVKDETIHLFSGEMLFFVGTTGEDPGQVKLSGGESYHITPGTVHGMVAVTDCEILEVSTPHLEDVIRLEDRYDRISGAD